MSHVATIEIQLKDLDALDAACRRVGIEFLRDKPTFAWFGTHVGDYPLPAGFTAEDMGRCEHAIRVPGATYEIGVVRRRDGQPGYTLLWDFWASGGLTSGEALERIGVGGRKLVQAYGVEVATRAARRQGYTVTETTKADGSIVLRARAS